MLDTTWKIFEQLNYWHWFGLGITLAILEMLLGGSFLFLWLGLIAILTGISVWFVPTLIWQYQLLIFTIDSIIMLIVWKKFLSKKFSSTMKPEHAIKLNRRNEQYIGRIFTLTEPIVNGIGKIQVDDSTWRVSGPDLPVGASIEVIGVDGIILKVVEKK